MASLLKLKIWLLAFLTVFAPVQAVLHTTFVLILIDLVTGIIAARKQDIPITSSKMKITIIKLFVYEAAIMLAYIVGRDLTGPGLPVLNMVSSVVGLTEMKSVLENINIITGGTLLNSILKALSANIKND